MNEVDVSRTASLWGEPGRAGPAVQRVPVRHARGEMLLAGADGPRDVGPCPAARVGRAVVQAQGASTFGNIFQSLRDKSLFLNSLFIWFYLYSFFNWLLIRDWLTRDDVFRSSLSKTSWGAPWASLAASCPSSGWSWSWIAPWTLRLPSRPLASS